MLTKAALAAAALLLAYGLHRLALWAEARGSIYYRRRHGSSGLPRAVLEVQALFEPQQCHVLEQRVREPVEDDESGDPPAC
jgi:hypothetical protein